MRDKKHTASEMQQRRSYILALFFFFTGTTSKSGLKGLRMERVIAITVGIVIE